MTTAIKKLVKTVVQVEDHGHQLSLRVTREKKRNFFHLIPFSHMCPSASLPQSDNIAWMADSKLKTAIDESSTQPQYGRSFILKRDYLLESVIYYAHTSKAAVTSWVELINNQQNRASKQEKKHVEHKTLVGEEEYHVNWWSADIRKMDPDNNIIQSRFIKHFFFLLFSLPLFFFFLLLLFFSPFSYDRV